MTPRPDVEKKPGTILDKNDNETIPLRRPFTKPSSNLGLNSPSAVVRNPSSTSLNEINNASQNSPGSGRRSSGGGPDKNVASNSSSRNSPDPDRCSPGQCEDAEEEDSELTKLRCKSIQTEEIVSQKKEKQEREKRRNRCADYPGFAFGSAMFGSDTTMKFNIIKNELHNIMKSQLRRVDGEVSALAQRIKDLDVNLAKSEQYIKTATVALAEAVQYELENRKETQEEEREENALSHFDAQLKLLEGKLQQAKLLNAQVSSEENEATEKRERDKELTVT